MGTKPLDCTYSDSKQRIQDVLWNAGSQFCGRRSSQTPISDRWHIYKNGIDFPARFSRSSPRLDYRPQSVTCCNILCQISEGNSTLDLSSCVWQKTPCENDKLYCKTQSPLSLGILESAMTFCTWRASFSALKRTKQTSKKDACKRKRKAHSELWRAKGRNISSVLSFQGGNPTLTYVFDNWCTCRWINKYVVLPLNLQYGNFKLLGISACYTCNTLIFPHSTNDTTDFWPCCCRFLNSVLSMPKLPRGSTILWRCLPNCRIERVRFVCQTTSNNREIFGNTKSRVYMTRSRCRPRHPLLRFPKDTANQRYDCGLDDDGHVLVLKHVRVGKIAE